MTKLLDGKLHTKESIVKKYKNLVYYLAKKLAGSYELEDLASEGFIGLLYAFDKYETGHGIKFSTFARHRIYQHMLRVMRKPATGPYYPHMIVVLSWRIVREGIEELPATEIARKVDEPVAHVERALMYLYTRHPAKLDGVLQGLDTEMTLHEVIGKSDDLSGMYIRDFISSLSALEQQVIRYRGMNMTQAQIGKSIGYSQVHVSRILRDIQKKYNRYEMKGAM